MLFLAIGIFVLSGLAALMFAVLNALDKMCQEQKPWSELLKNDVWVVTCPETRHAALVEVARRRVTDCSLWPEMGACGKFCAGSYSAPSTSIKSALDSSS